MINKILCIFILIATIVAQVNAIEIHDIFWRYGADQSQADSGPYKVGDTLVFRYPSGIENVVEVDQKSYENCIVPPSAKVYDSGFDEIELNSPGPRWFICGLGNGKRCKEGGMKLHIDVKPAHAVETSIGPSDNEIAAGDDKGKTENVNGKDVRNKLLTKKRCPGRHRCA